MTALYLTIWIALALFVAGESGRSFARPGARPPGWAWWAFTTGALLAIVHTLQSFHLVHHWSHADAVRATAEQTRALYGIDAGWGIYVNYAFLVVWLADAWWWRTNPAAMRRPAVTWTLRGFYLLIIFNGAIVFAAGLRKILGLLIVSWLVRVWSVNDTRTPPATVASGPIAAPSSRPR
jgi:hypothetical protein